MPEFPTGIIVGITGTRQGMTPAQRATVIRYLTAIQPLEAHHGDAVGADSEFHDLVLEVVKSPFIVVHPPQIDRYRAYREGNIIKKVLPFLVRDDNIIKSSNLMLATPFQVKEQARSGTWATIRHTRNFDKALVIVWPDGTTQPERLHRLEVKSQHVLDF